MFVGILLLAIPQVALAQRAAEPKAELTFAEFRALLRPAAQAPGQTPEDARRRAEEGFFLLLAAQARVAAVRQSVDRLSGWAKAAATRLAAQSAPPLDVETLRFAEAKAEARLARFEAEQRRAARQVNSLLGRKADSPLLALTSQAAPDSADKPGNAGSAPGEFANRRAQFEQGLLPQARDLVGKTYQNYLFGGVSLSALLWQEEQVYETELQYRLLLVEVERELAEADAP
jgi:hypothetical protein